MFAGCVSRGDYDRLQKLVENQDRVIRNLKEYNQDLQMKYDRAASNDPILQEQLDKALKELEIYKEQTAKLEKKWQDRVSPRSRTCPRDSRRSREASGQKGLPFLIPASTP